MLQVNISDHFLFKDIGIDTVENPLFPDLASLLNVLVPNIFILAGVIAFIYMLAGGAVVIVNAGNTEKTKQGSQMITQAMAGLILIFISFWLIQIVATLTGINFFNSGL